MWIPLLCLWYITALMPFTLTKRLQPSCPKEYLRYSSEHSFCKAKNPRCDIRQSGVNEADKNFILDLHNSFRSVIAKARDKSNQLPPASDMLEMEWDEELARVAQSYAQQCLFDHDPSESRRVVNFGVGQNLALQKLSGYNVPQPVPDWNFSITNWFKEIVSFRAKNICKFGPSTSASGVYGHFTQMIWSTTFRIGCGYTLYRTSDKTWHRLYVCNYGPMGNIRDLCVYKQGPSCSQCPINTCCTTTCKGYNTKNPGLCARINDKPPQLPITEPTLFNCDYIQPDNEDCLMKTEGTYNWKIVPALGGHYLEAVLYPGQNSTILFTKPINPSTKKFCVWIKYRKGPNIAGQLENNHLKLTYVVPSFNHKSHKKLPSNPPDNRYQFYSYGLTLQWKEPTYLSLNFFVPMNSVPQFLNLKSIIAYDGTCHN